MLRGSCILLQMAQKTELQREDLLEVEPLVCRGSFLPCKVAFWPVCRHSFATYHAVLFRNLPELKLEMGHRDTSLLRSRYMVPAHRRDAVAFWRGAWVPGKLLRR